MGIAGVQKASRGGLGRAADEFAAALGESRRRRAAEQRRRRRVLAIDELLAELEEGHLRGETELPGEVRLRLAGLAGEVGPLPRHVRRARGSVELHGALLDLQEEVLGGAAGGPRPGAVEDAA